jgi:hypothetical protein
MRHKKQPLDKSPFILRSIINIKLYFTPLLTNMVKYRIIFYYFFNISPVFINFNLIQPNINKKYRKTIEKHICQKNPYQKIIKNITIVPCV